MGKGSEITTSKPTGSAVTTNTAPRGLENFKQEDLIVPRLRLLQPGSQAVADGLGAFGQFQDSLSGDILGDKIELVLLTWKNAAVYFKENEGMVCKSDDGITSIHGDRCSACPYGEYWDKKWSGDQPPACSEAKEFIVVTRDTLRGKEVKPYLVSFMKTSLPIGKRLISMLYLAKEDLFTKSYILGSEKTKNRKGNFAKMKIDKGTVLTPDEFMAAEKWYETVTQANVRVEGDFETLAGAVYEEDI